MRTPMVGVRVARDEEIEIRSDDVALEGHLTSPDHARGIVLFAHGSGSSRHSPRNRFVARQLNDAALSTLLFDLLTAEEAANRANVFDVELLARRLLDATRSIRADADTGSLPVGYFGASTGAAAALVAAAVDHTVGSVVSRGGRPDLAGDRLGAVRAPTLLIVGGADVAVLQLNRDAARRLQCPHRLDVVPGATHLFEEPGTLETASDLAATWFLQHLGAPVR